MSFKEKIMGTITNPDSTIKSIAEKPLIEEAVLIVGIYAIFEAIAAYIQSYKITYVLEGLDNTLPMQSLMAISTIIFALIGPFIIWFIVTGVIHLLSMAAGGEGKFYPQMMTVIGYSKLPMIFAGIINIVIFSLMEPQTIIISQTDPAAMKNVFTSPPFIISAIAGILLQLWSTILLFFCIRSAHKLSSTTSAVIAAIPLVFSIISLILTLRGSGIL